jgi:hypothetical protein
MWEEEVVAKIKTLFQHFYEATEKNTKNLVRIADLWDDAWTWDLQNAKRER